MAVCKEGHFLYFAFGSNLLKERLQLNSPSAVYKTIAKLENYVLDFDCWNPYWMGCAATITENPGREVWGTVWELRQEHRETLDRQEGVHLGYYDPLEVTLTSPTGDVMTCLTYKLCDSRCGGADGRPSPQYLEVIQRGAAQSGLPQDYCDLLAQIEHNGYSGQVEVYDKVNAKQET